MKVISRFEANLVRILRYFVQRVPAEQALPLLVQPCARPRCLSRASVDLVKDSLAKGCMLLLVRRGGWRRERHLRDEKVVAGRLWQRTPPQELGLEFSRQSLRFLIWATAAELPAEKPRTPLAVQELTVGDWLLFHFAYEALRQTGLGPGLRNQPAFAANPLCRLAFPDDFSDNPSDSAPNFKPWIAGVGGAILEALQQDLSARWLEIERDKARYHNWRRLRAVGRAQEQVLDAYFEAIVPARRLDLARFLVGTAAAVVREKPDAWVEQLDLRELRLAERGEVYRAALVMLHQLDRFHEQERQARGIGFHDEGYAAAQLFKSDWEEARGEELHAAAQQTLTRWQSWQ